MTGSSRLAFSTLAFPGTTLARAAALGSEYGYQGIELRLIDGELIDPSMPASARATVRQTVAAAGLPIIAVDSSIKLTGDNPGAELNRFLELASDWECPLVRVFGGGLSDDKRLRREQLAGAARVLEAAIPLAERTGVAIGVETHDAFSSAARVAELLAMVDSPMVGAVWDSHHPHRMGERPADVYDLLGRRQLLAQVKDARRVPGLDLRRVGETLASRDRRTGTRPATALRAARRLADGSEPGQGSGSAMTKHGFGTVGTGCIAETLAP
jgi:sugar phosphate isomerase/epimerase